MKKQFLVVAVLLALVIAPASRIYKAGLNAHEPSPDTQPLLIPGLISLGSFNAANQGPYKIRGYQHKTCDGSIALLTLYRNAEGSHILRKIITGEDIRYGVIFKQTIYTDFPQWDFTVYTITHSFKRLFFNTEPQRPPQAFAEKGECEIASLITDYYSQYAILASSK